MKEGVRFLRLKTGEDLISEVRETENAYVLMNPCKVVYFKSSKTGFLSISLMQWIFSKICTEQVFEISKSEILTESLPDSSFIKHYRDSIEHFTDNESKEQIEYDSPIDEESNVDSMELLKSLLNIKDDKGTLH
jgi:hypothetical protein